MERIVNISKSFEDADDWDLAMTHSERQAAAKLLKARLHPQPEDVRDCLRDGSNQVIFQKTYRS